MNGWLFKCSFSPLQLVLTLLYEKPKTIREMKKYAECLYGTSPYCWSSSDIDRVLEHLLTSGLVVRKGNLFYLRTREMHPITREILIRSLELRGLLHSLCSRGVASA